MPQDGARGQNLGTPIKLYIAVCLYKQLLNKEGWASDMYITSTFSVIRSLWPYFHAPVILSYILKTISWINVILGILVLCDTTTDIFTNVGPVILPYILNVIWCMSIIIWDYESVWSNSWPKSKCRSLTYISWSSDFVTSWRQFDVWLS